MPDEPLALPLACWARGNWEVYHDPQAAIQSYRSAMTGYQAGGDTLNVARLLSNLVFACCDCGLFAEAQAAYAQAQTIAATCSWPCAPIARATAGRLPSQRPGSSSICSASCGSTSRI